MEVGGRGKDAFVTITKTREWFSQNAEKIIKPVKEELERLKEKLGGDSDGSASKKARLE